MDGLLRKVVTDQLDASVIVIGGGPCGLILAIELGRRGIRTVVLEERSSAAGFPQANATQARTMEHYRRLGFAERVRAQGLPQDYPTDVAYFTRFASHELARFSLPTARNARELIKALSGSWSAAELPHRCSQMFVERVLRAEAEALENVTIRPGWRATGLQQSTDSVAVMAESATGQGSVKLRASFVVGADGGGSMTRKSLGYGYVGEAGVVRDFMGGRMFAIYVRTDRLYAVIPHARAWGYWTVNRDRRSFIFAINGKDEFSFHTQLRADEREEDITDVRATAMLQAALGAPLDVEIIARSSWTAGYTLVAEKFRQGRIFMGGDAVHLFTPTGGLGYNTAVEDAVNLGWKLAAIVNGWGGPALLDSYEIERQAIAKRNTGYARGFAQSIGDFIPPAELEDDGPSGDAARKAAGEYLNAHARAEFNIPGVTFGGRYDGSPIIMSDGTTPPPDAANTYVPTACPGGRAPHMWLPDGRSLFDVLGFEFTLLRLGPRPAGANLFVDAAAKLAIPLTVVDIASEEARSLYGADLALVRPDQIVAWRGNKLADPIAILRRATGHLM
jgi:2-polyprenyl-6-methoxyphenol hydroxylase-like FAD-dependent oxidoreductase